MSSPALLALHGAKLAEDRARGAFTWPNDYFLRDPVGWAWHIAGVALTGWQASVLEAMVSSNMLAVKGARKGGKSKLQALGAAGHFTCYDDATSILVAPTEGQIQRVVYHDLLQLHAASGRCVSCKLRDPGGPRPCPHSACIDGEPSPSCRAGIQVGARRIFGIAPRNADHMRGISGPHQAYFLDESPGIDLDVKDACAGNVAAAGRLVTAWGNPSVRHGWFYDAHAITSSWRKFTWSALESPNVVLGRPVVAGLASAEWVESMRADLQPDDPRWQCDVLGEFPSRDMMRVVDDAALKEVFLRAERGAGDGAGGLFVGIDAAGGTGGDSSVIAIRRGFRFEPLHGFQGATDRIMVELEGLLRLHRRGGEHVEIRYDSAGRYGKDLGIALGQLRRRDDELVSTGLDGRGRIAKGDYLFQFGYSRPRDCYWGNMAQLLKSVVAIPYHEDFAADLTFAEWTFDPFGRSKLLEKTEQRKATGRSPDFGDAVGYALWEGRVAPLSEIAAEVRREADADTDAGPSARQEHDRYDNRTALTSRGGGLDVYSAGSYRGPGRGGGGGGVPDFFTPLGTGYRGRGR